MKEYEYSMIFESKLESIVTIQRTTLNESFGVHKHVNFFEGILIINGSSLHVVNDKSSYIKAGDFFVLGGNSTHAFINPDNLEIVNIMYKKDVIMKKYPFLFEGRFSKNVLFLLPMVQEDRNYVSIFNLNNHQLEHLKRILDVSICNDNEAFPRFVEMVLYLSREIELDFENDQVQIYMHEFSSILDYIDKHYAEELSLDELALMSHFSKRTISRMFEKYFNTTPYRYIMDKRISLSKSYLRQTEMSIVEISLACGFRGSNYFTRVFKKYCEMTPSEYRKVRGL